MKDQRRCFPISVNPLLQDVDGHGSEKCTGNGNSDAKSAGSKHAVAIQWQTQRHNDEIRATPVRSAITHENKGLQAYERDRMTFDIERNLDLDRKCLNAGIPGRQGREILMPRL